MNTYDTVHIEIKVVPIFICTTCGARGNGMTARISMNVADLSLIYKALTSVHPSHLPIGWLSYGTLGVRCPKHAI